MKALSEEIEKAKIDESTPLVNSLITFAREMTADIFFDKTGQTYVALNVGNNAVKAVPLNSSEFKSMLASEFYDTYQKAVSNETINIALNILNSKAYLSNTRSDLRLRSAVKQSTDSRAAWKIYVDLGRTDYQILEISGQGYKIVPQSAPIFKRVQSTDLIDKIEEGGRLELEEFVRLFKLKDPEDLILLIGWMGVILVPEIANAILVLYGPQGSTKSTLSKAIGKTIDPHLQDTVGISRDKAEMIQNFSHHYLNVIDNMSVIRSDTTSDILCRMIYGESFSKRQLWTDDNDFTYTFRHFALLNGINIPLENADFLDRALLIELRFLPDSERKSEDEVNKIIRPAIPKIRGAIFSGLAGALLRVDEVEKDLVGKIPRLADFVVWAEAFSRAIGYKPNLFYNRFIEKIQETSKLALESSPVGELVLTLIETEEKENNVSFWWGSPSDLLERLKGIDTEKFKLAHSKTIPRDATRLSHSLNKIESNLVKEGIKLFRHKGGKGSKRRIALMRECSGATWITDEKMTTWYLKCNSCFDSQEFSSVQAFDEHAKSHVLDCKV